MDALLPIIGHGAPLQAHRPDCQNPYGGLQFEGRCFNDTRGYCAWPGISKGSKYGYHKCKTCVWGHAGPQDEGEKLETLPSPWYLRCTACVNELLTQAQSATTNAAATTKAYHYGCLEKETEADTSLPEASRTCVLRKSQNHARFRPVVSWLSGNNRTHISRHHANDLERAVTELINRGEDWRKKTVREREVPICAACIVRVAGPCSCSPCRTMLLAYGIQLPLRVDLDYNEEWAWDPASTERRLLLWRVRPTVTAKWSSVGVKVLPPTPLGFGDTQVTLRQGRLLARDTVVPPTDAFLDRIMWYKGTLAEGICIIPVASRATPISIALSPGGAPDPPTASPARLPVPSPDLFRATVHARQAKGAGAPPGGSGVASQPAPRGSVGAIWAAKAGPLPPPAPPPRPPPYGAATMPATGMTGTVVPVAVAPPRLGAAYLQATGSTEVPGQLVLGYITLADRSDEGARQFVADYLTSARWPRQGRRRVGLPLPGLP